MLDTLTVNDWSECLGQIFQTHSRPEEQLDLQLTSVTPLGAEGGYRRQPYSLLFSGPLTPLLADKLKEAEQIYPGAWFEEAFEIAVSRNVRNWKYIEAILSRWKENGKDERRDSQDSVKDAKRYTESEFSEFLKRD